MLVNNATLKIYFFLLRYFIKEGDTDIFRINASTGDISLLRALDREIQEEYVLSLVAMDTGKFKSYVMFWKWSLIGSKFGKSIKKNHNNFRKTILRRVPTELGPEHTLFYWCSLVGRGDRVKCGPFRGPNVTKSLAKLSDRFRALHCYRFRFIKITDHSWARTANKTTFSHGHLNNYDRTEFIILSGKKWFWVFSLE